VSDDILSSRRALRVPARCAVRAETDSFAWAAETEDVGPNGCRLAGPRPMESGQRLRLEITSPRARRLLQAAGRVAWCSPDRPFTFGVAFDEAVHGESHGWFERLVADDPELLVHGGMPDRLGPQTVIYLGEPPAAPGQAALSADELEVVRRIGDGVTLGQLRDHLSATWARSRRVLLALLSRRLLTVSRGEAAGPGAWEALLRAPRRAAPARRATDPALQPRRSEEAQAALDEGRRALAEGRFGSARALLSHAALLAPGDAEIRAALDKAMWGIGG
jgi:hypothetical protein